MHAKRTLIVSLLVVLVVGTVQELTNREPGGIRRFTGLLFLAIFLAVIGEALPKVAGALAVLIAVATVFSYQGFFAVVENATNSRRTIGTASAAR